MIGLIIALVFGLSTDYEVFLVSRMVERESAACRPRRRSAPQPPDGHYCRGADCCRRRGVRVLRPGDDGYLAFGLMAALLLDATVVRMF